MRTVHIQLNKTSFIVKDDSNDQYVDISIPGLFQLMDVDFRSEEDDFLKDILQDISQSKITVYQYSFAGMKVFDVEVQGSAWSDYPRSLSVWKQLLKRFGRKKKVGNMRLKES